MGYFNRQTMVSPKCRLLDQFINFYSVCVPQFVLIGSFVFRQWTCSIVLDFGFQFVDCFYWDFGRNSFWANWISAHRNNAVKMFDYEMRKLSVLASDFLRNVGKTFKIFVTSLESSWKSESIVYSSFVCWRVLLKRQ